MQYLKVTQLTKSYSHVPLVDHVDFTISAGQKIALVARNGAGKSTLMQLLLGNIDKTDGDISWRKGLRIASLAQEPDLDPEMLVLDALFATDYPPAKLLKQYEQVIHDPEADPAHVQALLTEMDAQQVWSYESKVSQIITQLHLQDYLKQTIATLSGGEAKRVALAQILIQEPDIFFLDEPTNHLDLDMIEWLERYLTQTHITLFMVTHDRYFLERICTDIFSLERGKLIQYPGNYSYFLEKKAEREENEQIALHKLKQLLRKELAWIRRAPSGRQTKSDFRAKRYEDIQDSYTGKRKDAESKSQRLVLEVKERTLGSKIVVCKHVQKSFGDKVILKDFTYEFRYRDRVGIIGKNGVGKTTFLQLLLGEALPDGGTIVLGETIVVGYYQQKQMQFPEEKKLIDVVPFPTLLEKFLFPPAQQHQRISTLSGGEKKRLQLLTILMHNPNFLILDEPTNDLDVLTLGVLEDFLLQYKGCLIVVSHDRFFMDRIVEHLFVFTGNGAIDDFRGTYSEYAATNSSPTLAVASQRKVISLVEEEEDDKKSSLHKKLSYNEKRELDALAQDIETLESRKDEVNRLFNQKDLSYDEITFLSEELGDILKQLEQKEYRRLELSERV